MKMATCFVVTLLLTMCSREPNNGREATGFIVFNDPAHWRFIPVVSMNSENCFDDFETKNLRTGVAIEASSLPDYSFLKRTLDTLSIENHGEGYPDNHYRLKITPVEVNYSVDSKYVGSENVPKSNFQAKVLGRTVQFGYNYIPISISCIEPLFCLNKEQLDIHECECKHDDSDPNDYLFKICEFVKAADKFSDLPCRYHIRNVDTTLFKGENMIKVSLTCCYLGDEAYFDPVTKEIVDMYYGGM
ncbi:MAG: hypothetical protein QM762_13880 [Chryseolinea sp.]